MDTIAERALAVIQDPRFNALPPDVQQSVYDGIDPVILDIPWAPNPLADLRAPQRQTPSPTGIDTAAVAAGLDTLLTLPVDPVPPAGQFDAAARHDPAPVAASGTHPHRLPVPVHVFDSYAYLAGTLGVVEAPLVVMQYRAFQTHCRQAFPHGGVPGETLREKRRRKSLADTKLARIAGWQDAADYYAQRQVLRDMGTPVDRLGPQAGPDSKRGPRVRSRVQASVAPPARELYPYSDAAWWAQRDGETAVEWHARVSYEELPLPAREATMTHNPDMGDKGVARQEAARLRRRAAEYQRAAAKLAAQQADAALGLAPQRGVAVPLTREQDVARRLTLSLAQRVAEDSAAVALAGRQMPPMPHTMARIAREAGR